MATYVVLARFTAQGVKNAKDSPKRAEAFKQMADTFGVVLSPGADDEPPFIPFARHVNGALAKDAVDAR